MTKKGNRQLRLEQWKAAQPKLDANSYQGKLKILADVQKGKYKMPKDFTVLLSENEQRIGNTSHHYQTTYARRQELDDKRTDGRKKIPDKDFKVMPAFRNADRQTFQTFEQRKTIHGPHPTRYSPLYDRVDAKSPSFAFKTVENRFDYNNPNDVNFIKEAEGQD